MTNTADTADIADITALTAEAIDTYEGLLHKARHQRTQRDKKAWAKEAAILLLSTRHAPPPHSGETDQ